VALVPPLRLHRTPEGPLVETGGRFHAVPATSWDELLNGGDLPARLADAVATPPRPAPSVVLAPISGQEVWAAGVTYFRSRDARREESAQAGGGSFYDRVYEAERPELFFKAAPHRVVGPGGALRLRRDSRWVVPEPELTLVIDRGGTIVGTTIGNDLSCRDIEGENPLYLPQAKTFDGCAALGPAILIGDGVLPPTTEIRMCIRRGGEEVFAGATTLDQLRRSPAELVEFLYREASFPAGCFLLTGTGIVPPGAFTLASGDQVEITIAPIGTLSNTVTASPLPAGR
jgi:2-dehydro-3-deoxy-D-arabinonate dehydratase